MARIRQTRVKENPWDALSPPPASPVIHRAWASREAGHRYSASTAAPTRMEPLSNGESPFLGPWSRPANSPRTTAPRLDGRPASGTRLPSTVVEESAVALPFLLPRD